ncbi:MAG TPA: 7-cyano-7-deazaguanine synthase QueC [Gemmatimonadales bacterium]|jgi:7-cyano-7-deazaguanine synthase
MTGQRAKAIVLLSGGMDSATCLAVARAANFEIHALSFRYGQRHAVELTAAAALAAATGATEHRIVDIDLRAFGGSALTADLDVPKDRTSDEIGMGVPITYVPARNTIFLSFALAHAEVIGAHDIYIGVNALDYSGYPDCRPPFIAAFQATARLGSRLTDMTIRAPLLRLTKPEIVELGRKLGVDFGMTRSCYDPDPSGHACGHCDACILRLDAFARLGLADPAPYQGMGR